MYKYLINIKNVNRGKILTYHVVYVVHLVAEAVFVLLELDFEEFVVAFEAPRKGGLIKMIIMETVPNLSLY